MRLGVAILVSGALSCAEPTARPPADDPGARLDVFVPPANLTLVKSEHSGLNDSTRLVVRDRATWETLWASIHASVTPAPPVLAPDFGEELAVVVALGERPSGGHEIRVDSVTRHERGLVVYVTKTEPGSGCFTTGVIVHPVHAVRVPRVVGAVRFRETMEATACR